MTMTLYSARCIGNEKNCKYPRKMELRDEESFRQAVSRDYVAVAYQNNYRKNEHFLSSDCLGMDCDNDHSDREEDWVTPEKVQAFFDGVAMGFHFSRHHQKQKENRSARPRFHCLLAIRPTESAEAYAGLKKRVMEVFPFFDPIALDAARFFYGSSDPQVRLIPGEMTLDQWLEQREEGEAAASARVENSGGKIPEGRRNRTLSQYAAKVLKRFGDKVQLATRPLYAGDVLRLLQPVQQQSLSQAAMETLAVVAYKQPVTRAEVEQIRGVKCDYSLQSLMNKGLIRETGRKGTIGRPILFGTTDEFLSHFGLEGLDNLPPMPENREDESDFSDDLPELIS